MRCTAARCVPYCAYIIIQTTYSMRYAGGYWGGMMWDMRGMSGMRGMRGMRPRTGRASCVACCRAPTSRETSVSSGTPPAGRRSGVASSQSSAAARRSVQSSRPPASGSPGSRRSPTLDPSCRGRQRRPLTPKRRKRESANRTCRSLNSHAIASGFII